MALRLPRLRSRRCFPRCVPPLLAPLRPAAASRLILRARRSTHDLTVALRAQVAYFTASVGVVLNWKGEKDEDTIPQQRFFQSHDDDILCIAVDESRNYCATGQKSPLKRARGVQSTPTVSVWDLTSMQELLLCFLLTPLPSSPPHARFVSLRARPP